MVIPSLGGSTGSKTLCMPGDGESRGSSPRFNKIFFWWFSFPSPIPPQRKSDVFQAQARWPDGSEVTSNDGSIIIGSMTWINTTWLDGLIMNNNDDGLMITNWCKWILMDDDGLSDDVPVQKYLIYSWGIRMRNYGDRIRQPCQCCVLATVLCDIRSAMWYPLLAFSPPHPPSPNFFILFLFCFWILKSRGGFFFWVCFSIVI